MNRHDREVDRFEAYLRKVLRIISFLPLGLVCRRNSPASMNYTCLLFWFCSSWKPRRQRGPALPAKGPSFGCPSPRVIPPTPYRFLSRVKPIPTAWCKFQAWDSALLSPWLLTELPKLTCLPGPRRFPRMESRTSEFMSRRRVRFLCTASTTPRRPPTGTWPCRWRPWAKATWPIPTSTRRTCWGAS